MVKPRRVLKKDWDDVESFIRKELESRKGSGYRKSAEQKWREVDRQLAMEAMQRLDRNGRVLDDGWHSVMELGELSKASEIIAADIRRLIFPQARSWFEAHAKIAKTLSLKDGTPEPVDGKLQSQVDGVLRSLMVQQHQDFGLKNRFDLSVKEALHHGGFVAEARFESVLEVHDGTGVKTIGAPVWVPHSLWNCFPDPSPRVMGTDMFYTGSMIIVSYLPLFRVKQLQGPGYMPARYKDIPKRTNMNKDVETEDCEIIAWHGDLVISREDGDIFLPNCKAQLANGIMIYLAPSELPYPSVIYGTYERQDVRDPYGTSPLIKQSPWQKLGSVMANRFLDGVALKTEPPLIYDGNDPQFVLSGGPVIVPGASYPTKGSGKVQAIETGDPSWALKGVEMAVRSLQEGTGVSSIRSGVQSSDRMTATEITKTAQGSEVRTVDVVDKLEGGLRSFLYMQHRLNVRHLKNYAFYNGEMDSPDWIDIRNEDLPAEAHFEIVGSKGVLGEEQRSQKSMQWTAFLLGNPLTAELVNTLEIAKQGYLDAGNKSPERFLNAPKDDPKLQQAQQRIQQLQQALQQAQAKLQGKEMQVQAKVQGDQLKAQVAHEKTAAQHDIALTEIAATHQQHHTGVAADLVKHLTQ